MTYGRPKAGEGRLSVFRRIAQLNTVRIFESVVTVGVEFVEGP
jgi:hypothetical protein